MGRTSIMLDDALVAKAMRITGSRTKRQVVDVALRALVGQRATHASLLALRGRLQWRGDADGLRRDRVGSS